MARFLKCYEQEIDSVVKNNIQVKDDELETEWLNLRNGNIAAQKTLSKEERLFSANSISQRSYEAGDYLIKTKWHQDHPYNNQCPIDTTSNSGGRRLTGCVATAMAQVIRYWGTDRGMAPTHGFGYGTGYQGSYTANFGDAYYDYDNMPLYYDYGTTNEEINAISLLSYHCGVAAKMNYYYKDNGSGAFLYDAAVGLKEHFGYSDVSYKDKYDYGDIEGLKNILISELDKEQPVLYATDQHAFICDGYNLSDM